MHTDFMVVGLNVVIILLCTCTLLCENQKKFSQIKCKDKGLISKPIKN